jgi:nucleoside-diphosphate-sugar epimerase
VRYLTGSIDLLRQLADVGCRRLLISGTCFEYDTRVGYLGEDCAARPATLYAASKHALHVVAERLAADLDMQLAWARIFYQYGPFENPGRLVPSVVTSLLEGRPVETTAGDQVRDYLFVEDVASALVTIAEGGVRGPINVGSGVPITVRTLVQRIAELLGRADLLRLGALATPPGDPPFVCANAGRLRNEVGWEPQHSLGDGLARTIEWWRCAGERQPAVSRQ